ncbi:MAG: peptidylprolyl isomerase [Candidatus Marinimicrobia bacterium]|jgi:parvulin-like peptidyl-prolyl isomerase|nr:peptidylprolyl isomerase [Candidatus Neomarinimicrobiota bacterium]
MKKFIISIISLIILVVSCGRMNNDTVVKIDDKKYTSEHFFQTIPKISFQNIPVNKKGDLVNEYVLKKLAQLDLTEKGLLDSGELKIELDVWKFWYLVNFSYQKMIVDHILNKQTKRILYDRLSKELKARQLLISYNTAQHPLNSRSKEDAKILVNKIKNQISPASFALLCQKYSDDKYTKNKGGKLVGWIKTGRMLSPVDSALFSINKNNISNPVQSSYGYHFLMVDSSRALPVESFENEQFEIKQLAYKLWETKFNNRANSLIDSLQKANPIVFFNDSLISFYDSYSKLSKNVFHEKIYTTFDIMSIFDDSLVIGKIGDHNIDKQWIVFFLKTLDTKRPSRFSSIENVKSLVQDNHIPYLINMVAKENHLENEETYKMALDAQAANISYDYYNNHLIIENINPTNEEKKTFYNNYKDSLYKSPEMAVVKEILVSKKKLADSLLKRIKSGEKIELLAEKYSERNIGKYNKGTLPPFRKGQYETMGKAAFEMKIGEIGGPYKLGKYYSIIELNKKLSSKIKSYKEVEKNIKYDYIRINKDKIQAEVYDGLKDKHRIKINERFYKKDNDKKN